LAKAKSAEALVNRRDRGSTSGIFIAPDLKAKFDGIRQAWRAVDAVR
jgi:hypothetical protein